MTVVYWFFFGLGCAQGGTAVGMNIRFAQRRRRDRTQAVQADQRLIFPACTRAKARQIAEDWPGTVAFLTQETTCGWAWYAIRSTRSGETITLAGWCRTMRGCNRTRDRLRADAAADTRRFATRLPAA